MGVFILLMFLFLAFLIVAALFIFVVIPTVIVTFIKERKKYRQMYNLDTIMLSHSEELIEDSMLDTEQSAQYTQEYDQKTSHASYSLEKSESIKELSTMTIDQQMIIAIDELIATIGIGATITRKELVNLIHNKYGIHESSIIPSDYCYNRINNGISISKPTLFEHVDTGKYRCLGKNYPYNGPIYHKDIIIGSCENGERKIHGITEVGKQPIPHNKAHNRRDPSPRLRFEVLARDKFTCQYCGASPSKDPSVKLHIDHIIPWSKGGLTTIDNLQTLCSTCNLGKSDIIVE